MTAIPAPSQSMLGMPPEKGQHQHNIGASPQQQYA